MTLPPPLRNFSENSSVLEEVGIPKPPRFSIQFQNHFKGRLLHPSKQTPTQTERANEKRGDQLNWLDNNSLWTDFNLALLLDITATLLTWFLCSYINVTTWGWTFVFWNVCWVELRFLSPVIHPPNLNACLTPKDTFICNLSKQSVPKTQNIYMGCKEWVWWVTGVTGHSGGLSYNCHKMCRSFVVLENLLSSLFLGFCGSPC